MRKGPHLHGAALSFMESDQCGRSFIYILYNVHKNREEPEKGLHFLRIRCIIIRTKDQMVKEERNGMKHQKNMLCLGLAAVLSLSLLRWEQRRHPRTGRHHSAY